MKALFSHLPPLFQSSWGVRGRISQSGEKSSDAREAFGWWAAEKLDDARLRREDKVRKRKGGEGKEEREASREKAAGNWE